MQLTLPETPLAASPAPATLETAAPAPAPAPAPVPRLPGGPTLGNVKEIRIGDHLDRTRVVLDLTAEAPYRARLENNGRRLIIDMPQLQWDAARRWDAISANLVAGYTYDDGQLTLELLSPAQIKSQSILPPNGNAYQRLVIDLYAPDIHG